MFSETAIDADTIQAYLETEYQVRGQPYGHPAFILRAGEASTALAALHDAHRVNCSAFITACNPFSQVLDEAANAERQEMLARELAQRRLCFIEGIGLHPSGQWPGEPSFLVPGLTLDAARAVAARFEQNAIIWSGADAVPQLILLR